MAEVIRRRSLSRRAFLGAAGAFVALPRLDAMVPALARAPTPPLRAAFLFLPNGQRMSSWTPKLSGSAFPLPPILEPLAKVRRHVSVLSGLALGAGFPHGDGAGDHARAASTFLTAMHPKKTGGDDIHVGMSVDQAMAAKCGAATRLSSLEIGCEPGRASGICDSGYACAYSNTIAWNSPSLPLPKETRPR